MYRHVFGTKNQQRRNKVTVEISYQHHLLARGCSLNNTDFDQQQDHDQVEEAAKISSRRAHARSRSRADDNYFRNIEENNETSRIRDDYRHVEGVHRRDGRARFNDDHYYSERRNEGGGLHPSSSSRERSYQVYHSTYRPASAYKESNAIPSRGQVPRRGQVHRSETAPISSRRNNNPWLKNDNFGSYSYQGDSRGEEDTSTYRQQAHHPRAENSYHYSPPQAAYSHQDRDLPYRSSRPAHYSEVKEEDTPHGYRRVHIRERATTYPPSPQTSQREKRNTSSPSYHQREQKTHSYSHYHHQTNAQEKNVNYHASLPGRPDSRARSRHVHQQREEEGEDTYRSRHPRDEKSYSSHHGRSVDEDTYRSARHPRKEGKSYSSHHSRSEEEEEEEDNYRSSRHRRERKSYSSHHHGRSKDEEDTYRSRHPLPREEENTQYHHGRARPREEEEDFHHRHHQAHSKKEEEKTYYSSPSDWRDSDTYYPRPSYSRDSDSHYATRSIYSQDSDTYYALHSSYSRDRENNSYSSQAQDLQEEENYSYDYYQAHPRKEQASSHTNEAPRQEDQDHPNYSRQAHSDAKKESSSHNNTSRDEIKPSLPPRQPAPLKLVGELYQALKVSRDASHEEIVYAARKRRIEVHPDRKRKLPGMSPSDVSRINMEAQEVGLAADTLCDEASRAKYDRDLSRGLRT